MNFEILLSTKDRTDLSFLEPIFSDNKLDDVHVLIINQTTGPGLESNRPNIRVINSETKGSPQSRNLAIDNAKGEICLFADDDIIYLDNFKETILEAHKEFDKQDVISFEATDNDGNRYLRYSNPGPYQKNKFVVNTYVISFKRKRVQETNTKFNPHFGVGSTFGGSTEFLFMSNAWNNGLKLFHVDKFIVCHPQESSGKRQGSDDAVASRTALRYRLHGWLAYPWVLRYVFNMIRFKYISPGEFLSKIKVGFRAISTYKQLLKKGEMP